MPGPSATPTHRHARRDLRPVGSFGVLLLVVVALVACSSSATTPPAAVPASPLAIVSEAPSGSPSPEVANASPSGSASPSAAASPKAAASPTAAASPKATSSPGRYGGGPTPTPQPTPKVTPKPTAKPTPKPTPKPVSVVVKTGSSGFGTVLVGPGGLTLYTLKSDPANGSGCTGDCAANWPPFLVKNGTTVKGASGVSGSFSTFARSGKRQVTYKGRALYTYAGDAYAGDANGQAVGHVWYVAKP